MKQNDIYKNLKDLIGPGPAAFFHDACWMMENRGVLQCASHLVAHCLREIESALRGVLFPVASEGESIEEGSKKGFSKEERKSEATRKEQIQRILRWLGIGESHPIAQAWFQITDDLRGFIHRRGLREPRPISEIQPLWGKSQELFGVVLQGIREKVFPGCSSIFDKMLEKPQPPEEDIKKLVDKIPNNLKDLVGLGPAAFFHDACWMMENPDVLQCTLHLVARCLWEIESALRECFSRVASGGESTKEGSRQGFSKEERESEESQKEQIRRILRLLGIDEKDPIAQAWFCLADLLHRLAHRSGFEEPRPISEIQPLWEESQKLLWVVLQGIREKASLKWFSILDEMLKKPQPTRKDIKKLANEIPNIGITRNYFFNKLEHPGWLKPLQEEDFFKRPPGPVQYEDSVYFPIWPEAKYLAHMAKDEPDTVLCIIQEMNDTDNVAVHCDLIDAALAMPAELSAQLVEKAKKWVESTSRFLAPKEIGKLIVHWAKGGKTKEALDVAGALLDVSPTGGGVLQARFNERHYGKILKDYYPELIREIGLPALDVLCNILEKAIGLLYPQNEGPEDHSEFWRRAIEDHPQNFDWLTPTIQNMLVSAVRDGAELVVRSRKATVEEVVKVLEQRKWKVFRRIAIYVLGIFVDQDEQVFPLIEERLTNRSLFDDPGVGHEYTLLIRKCFSLLSEESKGQILSWIEVGPGRERWQLDQLARIRPENLPAGWQKRYRELVAKYGEPEHPEFQWCTEWGRVEELSPKEEEEFKAMSVAEIVDFLRSWEPPALNDSFRRYSPQGLGKVLSSVISQEPERFALEAVRFQGLHPTYIHAFFCGLREGLKRQRIFDWDPVLDLCLWVLEQPRDISGRQVDEVEAGSDWGGTRGEIADLLKEGFCDSPSSIPFELRKKVWDVLQPLTEDPDPTPEYEEKYSDSSLDPVDLSLNTTRGKAMHAVIGYALWVQRHLEKQVDGQERIRQGFEEMPEVRAVLEKHLEVSCEPSLAIRSIYGRWFPLLLRLDAKWAQENAERIFPTARDQEVFFETAWNSYVLSCCPYDLVFDILREQYCHAVGRIGRRLSDIRWKEDPDKRLAEHLMAFYQRGKIPLEDPLLRSFWEKAPDDLRSHALRCIGQWLRQTEEKISPEIIDRLKQLWESRLAQASNSPANFAQELFAFSWWIVSGKFDMAWAIVKLWEACDLMSKIEPADWLVDKIQLADELLLLEILAEIVEVYPEKSVECLGIIIKSSSGWDVIHAHEAIRNIFKVALQDPRTREKATQLINYLCSRGFLKFRDLLDGEIEN